MGQAKPEKPALNARQERFCQEYVAGKKKSATEAAKLAGYSERTAHSQGPRLLAHAGIQARVREIEHEALERLKLDQEEVLREVALIVREDMRTYATWSPEGVRFTPSDELPEGAGRCVQSIKQKVKILRTYTPKDGSRTETHELQEIELKLHDKPRMIELAAKINSLIGDGSELDVKLKGRVGLEGTLGIMTPPVGEAPEDWEERVNRVAAEREANE